jgi:Tol biopolymer transport system component
VITHVAGAARAWSPDGRRLALARPEGLVLVAPMRGAVPRLVARTRTALTWVAFTPDGRDIAFAGATGDARIVAATGGPSRAFSARPGGTWSRDGRYAVAVAGRQGVRVQVRDSLGHVREVSGALPYDDQSVSIVAWSGDGRALLYDTSASGLPELWSMHADGSGQSRLSTTARPLAEPAWSAAGTRLAYSSAVPGGGGIVLADARGRTLARVGADQGGSADDSPSWSPSGRRLAVADSQAGGITVVDTAGGRRTDVAVDGVAPAWSPDGSTIAFVDLDDGTVWGSAANGAGRHRLLPAAIRGVRALAWSPDGKRLAFSTDTGISIATPDGTDPGRAIVRARAPGRPSFSPRGNQIAYAAETGAVHPYRAIFVAGVDGRERRQLTTGPYDSRDPAWRPASR